MIECRKKSQQINYRIIEKKDNKIVILCLKEEYFSIIEILQENGFTKKIHPWSKYYGYRYEYQLSELLLFSNNEGFEVEIFFELPCMSLTPKVLIPLDKVIQKKAWENPYTKENRYYMNKSVYTVYLITNAIFSNRLFKENECLWLIQNKGLLEDSQLYLMLNKVFFSFTDVLIEKIRKEQFVDIFECYITFCQY